MLNKLIKVAYPYLSEDSLNLDSYYLVRLGELWGEGLVEEYLDCLQPSHQSSSNLLDNSLEGNAKNQVVTLSA
ncbi:MAG: hypothetical protein AB4041_09680 [Microcystaceae cyanobacterium]